MIGACWLGLFLTFSGVPVGSATMQASALAVPRRRLVMRSSEREVGAASVRGAAHVAHGVPSDRAGQDICKQSSSMALAIQNLIRAPSAVSGRLRVAAHGRLTPFRAVSGLEGLSVRANN